MRSLQQQVPRSAGGIMVGSGRHIVTDTADSCRGAAAEGIAIRVEGHTGAGGDMGDMLGMNALTFDSLSCLAVAWGRRVGMTGSTIGADGISRCQGNSPAGIGKIVRAAGVTSFAVTGGLIVVRTIAVHLNLAVTMRRKRIEGFPVACAKGKGIAAARFKVMAIFALIVGTGVVLGIDRQMGNSGRAEIGTGQADTVTTITSGRRRGVVVRRAVPLMRPGVRTVYSAEMTSGRAAAAGIVSRLGVEAGKSHEGGLTKAASESSVHVRSARGRQTGVAAGAGAAGTEGVIMLHA